MRTPFAALEPGCRHHAREQFFAHYRDFSCDWLKIDKIAGFHQVEWYICAPAVNQYMTVGDDLPRHRPCASKRGSVDHVVKSPFKEAEQVQSRGAWQPPCPVKVTPECSLRRRPVLVFEPLLGTQSLACFIHERARRYQFAAFGAA